MKESKGIGFHQNKSDAERRENLRKGVMVGIIPAIALLLIGYSVVRAFLG